MPYDTRLMEARGSTISRLVATPYAAFGVVIALACLRLAHVHLLWADEDYHIAAAIHMLHGKVPYRDFWYDKPPLDALFYLMAGGYSGWALRLLDAAYILIACALAYKIARLWWGNAEGSWAALFIAFFTTFYLPSAVIPFAADALMIVPHLAAIYCAACKLPLRAGVWTGVAFLFNIKAAFVFATCALWLWPDVLLLGLGFTGPVLFAFVCSVVAGSFGGYYEQVWRWGILYAKGSPVTAPFRTGFVRTVDWLGFHAALALSAAYAFAQLTRSERFKLGAWLVLSFAAVCLGTRFAPHYFLQVLPPVAIVAARGTVLAVRRTGRIAVVVLCLLLAVPFIRFGPRYAALMADNLEGREPRWSDVQLDLDSQRAAHQVLALAHKGDTLLVWGYRPDIYVYTRMTTDSRFWDSQPLTGVPADRHLSATDAIFSGPAATNRSELARSHPTFIVDGLGLMNPRLAPGVYPELGHWLKGYKRVGRTKLCVIYRKIDGV